MMKEEKNLISLPEAGGNPGERRLGSEPRVRWGSHPVLPSNTGAGSFYPLDRGRIIKMPTGIVDQICTLA